MRSDDYTLDHTKASFSGPSRAVAATLAMPTREAEEAILHSTLEVIAQPLPLLRSGTLSDAALAFKSKVIPGSSAGKHLRHVHSHFEILVDAMPDEAELEGQERGQAAAATGRISSSSSSSGAATATGADEDGSDLVVVDYDRRSRNLEMECSRTVAIAEYEALMVRLRRKLELSKGRLFDRELRVRATTPVVQEFRTTFGREIWFLALHAIHHYALLRICLHEQGIGLESASAANASNSNQHGSLDASQFGVAPSTLAQRSWKQELEKSRL